MGHQRVFQKFLVAENLNINILARVGEHQENTVVVDKEEGNNNLVLYIGSTGPNVLGKELNKFQTRDLLNIHHKCLNNKLLNILDNMATTSIFHNTMHGT